MKSPVLSTAASAGAALHARIHRRGRALLARLLAGVLLGLALPAVAHKASDAYLQIEQTPSGLSLRWDIALRDLDAALDLDADADGRLTWGEVKAAWPRVEGYALAHLRVEGCAFRARERTLERRNDGAYAVLHMVAPCVLAAAPVIDYTLFREVDPTHRGLAKIRMTGQPLVLRVLDPTRPSPFGGNAAGDAGVPTASSGDLPAARTPALDGDAAAEALARQGGSAAPGSSAGGLQRSAAGGALEEHVDARPGAEERNSSSFAAEGVRHILGGYDHILFLLCLLLPAVMRRTPQGWRAVDRLPEAVWPVVGIVSAFTVAHSLTLGLASTKVVSLSPAFIEPAIAVTIILAALDNLWPVFPVRRVVVAFFFGLVHGFGFAGVLSELDLPPLRFAWALLQFNLGLEVGQLLVVVSATAALFLVRRSRDYSLWVIRGGSCAAILVGVLWLIERTANVSILGV